MMINVLSSLCWSDMALTSVNILFGTASQNKYLKLERVIEWVGAGIDGGSLASILFDSATLHIY